MPNDLGSSGQDPRPDIRAHEQGATRKTVVYNAESVAVGGTTAAPVTEPRTVVVLDRRVLIRDLLARCLRSSTEGCVVYEFTSAAEFRQAGVLDPPPAVIILCAQGRDDAAVERELASLSEAATGIPAVVIADTEHADQVVAALNSGARGYIPTSVKLDIAKEALRFIQAGGTFVPASCLTSSHQSRSAMAPSVSPGFRLTPRQKAVLEALKRGKANKQIAYELNMREGTVKAHVRDIMRRLNVRNRTEVAVLANHGHFRSDDLR